MLYLAGYFSGKQTTFVRVDKMKNGIPVLTFLRAFGLTNEKFLLSINNPKVFLRSQQDEIKTFIKLGLNVSKKTLNSFFLVGQLLTNQEDNKISIVRTLVNIKIYCRFFEIFIINLL